MEENPYKTAAPSPKPPQNRTRTKSGAYIPIIGAVIGAVAAGLGTGQWQVATLLGGAFSGTVIGFILAALLRALR